MHAYKKFLKKPSWEHYRRVECVIRSNILEIIMSLFFPSSFIARCVYLCVVTTYYHYCFAAAHHFIPFHLDLP